MAVIDIEVKQGVLETYHNYPYKAPQVFGEFIDNSIQAFEDSKNLLTSDPNYVLRVDIKIDWEICADQIVRAKTIIIEDNSAGMTTEQFSTAFKSGDHSTIRMGMNEFGMGMKVAACWLGKRWCVETKSIAETVTHVIDIDVEKVSKENIKALESHETIDSNRSHGTKITINDMWPQTQIKKDNEENLINGIASIYRYFIRRGEIQICVNDHLLNFENYKILEMSPYTDWKGEKIQWTCPVNLHLGKYGVTGFVALLDEMDDINRGVVIMRNHRVVMGFDPSERTIGKSFMGQAGSNKYRRVFGELEITGFEVAFGKNQIIDLDQLEALMKAVAGKLKINNISLLTQADKFKEKTHRKLAGTGSGSTIGGSSSSGTSSGTTTSGGNGSSGTGGTTTGGGNTTTEGNTTGSQGGNNGGQTGASTTSSGGSTNTSNNGATGNSNLQSGVLVQGKFKFGGIDYKISVEKGTESPELFWNDLSKKPDNVLICKVNTSHAFFTTYGEPNRQSLAMIKALSIAKFKATMDSNDSASAMMNEFNNIINTQEVQE